MGFFEDLWTDVTEAADKFGSSLGDIAFAVIGIFLTLAAARLLIFISARLIRRSFARKIQRAPESLAAKKSETLSTLFCSIARYAIYFLAAVAVLELVGLGATVGSIIATAGIGGVAIGLGAQSFVKDVVAGFLILLEDEYAVGDYVEISGKSGTVASISLRTTRLTLYSNEIVAIPNGSIDIVTNYTRDSYKLFYKVNISPDEDADRAAEILKAVAAELAEREPAIIAPPEYLGVSHTGPDRTELLITLSVRPLDQWSVDRQMNAAVARAFRQNGVRLPEHTNVTLHET